jgi:hypothetical protein
MSRISDSVRLLGLIVKNKPFTYQDDQVTCSYVNHVSLDDLNQVRSELIAQQQKMLPNTIDPNQPSTSEVYTDQQRIEIADDIFFIDSIIENLTRV